ncbi:MAG: CPBP family intramembrane metalloprotease [Oceanospirillaceae bacterium]|nr:CPBP family intramembrane metalloprotease [Oceanospirillaceae bacterium]MCP5335605.1 CPBP family intramembrane metalloprotease [Oceanospirillaceae bacterium]
MKSDNKQGLAGLTFTIILSAAILLISLFLQLSCIAAAAQIMHGSSSNEAIAATAKHGGAITLAILTSSLIGIIITLLTIKLKNKQLLSYIQFNKIPLKTLRNWLLIALATTLIIEAFSLIFDFKEAEKLMLMWYSTAKNKPLLFITMVFIAPIFEELFFRGFLLSNLKDSFLGVTGGLIISSAAWAAIHMQYDLAMMVMIFFMGLVFGAAKIKTNSILTSLAMHSTYNAIAFIMMATMA